MNVDLHNALKSHAIMFPHDAPYVAAEKIRGRIQMLSLHDMVNTIRIAFVDASGRFDGMAQRIMGSAELFPRWWQLVSFLRVMKVINTDYWLVDIPEEAEVQRRTLRSRDIVLGDAEIMDDREAIARDNAVGSDMTETVQT